MSVTLQVSEGRWFWLLWFPFMGLKPSVLLFGFARYLAYEEHLAGNWAVRSLVLCEVLIDEAGLFYTFVSFHRQRFPQCYFSCLSNIPVSVPSHLVCPRTSLSPPGKHLLVAVPKWHLVHGLVPLGGLGRKWMATVISSVVDVCLAHMRPCFNPWCHNKTKQILKVLLEVGLPAATWKTRERDFMATKFSMCLSLQVCGV